MAREEKVFSPIVLMIDNETFSLRPDAYLTQVGYVVGNVLTGEVIEGPVDFDLTHGHGHTHAHIDIGTVKWWMKQSDAARKAVLDADESEAIRATPRNVFDEFARIVARYGDGLTVWASPAMFDLPQLTMAWRGRKPWKYNVERDMMTFYKLLDPYGQLKPADDGGIQHVASADALYQFKYLVALTRALGMAEADKDQWKTWAGVIQNAEAA